MKRFFNWILVLAACVGAFYGVGLIVPRSQTAGSRTNLTAKPDQAFTVIAEVGNWPAWHPDIAAAQELPERKGNPVWRLRNRDGRSYELEITVAEEPSNWVASYMLDGSRVTLRFDLRWYGEGVRVMATRTTDTRDPWKRAKAFLWSNPESSPIALLNAISAHLGETGQAEKN